MKVMGGASHGSYVCNLHACVLDRMCNHHSLSQPRGSTSIKDLSQPKPKDSNAKSSNSHGRQAALPNSASCVKGPKMHLVLKVQRWSPWFSAKQRHVWNWSICLFTFCLRNQRAVTSPHLPLLHSLPLADPFYITGWRKVPVLGVFGIRRQTSALWYLALSASERHPTFHLERHTVEGGNNKFFHLFLWGRLLLLYAKLQFSSTSLSVLQASPSNNTHGVSLSHTHIPKRKQSWLWCYQTPGQKAELGACRIETGPISMVESKRRDELGPFHTMPFFTQQSH